MRTSARARNFFLKRNSRTPSLSSATLLRFLDQFDVSVNWIDHSTARIPFIVGEFWTSKQRQSSSIHEISYRACFKAQLPSFFIERFSQAGNIVYDPFSGRGTTIIEAGLLGRRVISNDINPLSTILSEPRFFVPDMDELSDRLSNIPFGKKNIKDPDLSMFYHSDTAHEIFSLRTYLERRKETGKEDNLDRWIRMIATNRLSGHSSGFFSVYSLPPNQAVTPERQVLINKRLRQRPEYRDTRKLIVKKGKSLVRNLTEEQIENLHLAGRSSRFISRDARDTKGIPSDSIQLTVTSPPFLDIVDYSTDNWLRCWFNGLEEQKIASRITHARSIDQWKKVMGEVFTELYRITRKKGWVAFEVGELRKGTLRLEEHVLPLGIVGGFECAGIMINQQRFTKTSNIWGIANNRSGTNSNRIVVFYKP